MTAESITWFAGQALAMGLAALAGSRLARRRRETWLTAAVAATLLTVAWPLLRVFPVQALTLIGAPVLVFIELTGVVVPAALAFAIGARHVHRPADRRAVKILLVVCGLYLVHSGLWMLRRPPPDPPSSRYVDGVCRQSTGYTCVAASAVTLLAAHGIEAGEGEMARLSYTEVGRGTTDLRTVLALQRKLAGRPLAVHYERMDYARLRAVSLPALVPLKWGYFTSHMVAVLAVEADGVTLGDPQGGARPMSRSEFESEWLGRAVYLERQPR